MKSVESILESLHSSVNVRAAAVDVLVQVKSGQVSGGGGREIFFIFIFFGGIST